MLSLRSLNACAIDEWDGDLIEFNRLLNIFLFEPFDTIDEINIKTF